MEAATGMRIGAKIRMAGVVSMKQPTQQQQVDEQQDHDLGVGHGHEGVCHHSWDLLDGDDL